MMTKLKSCPIPMKLGRVRLPYIRSLRYCNEVMDCSRILYDPLHGGSVKDHPLTMHEMQGAYLLCSFIASWASPLLS